MLTDLTCCKAAAGKKPYKRFMMLMGCFYM